MGRIGQWCSLQELVPSEEAEPISTLLQVSSNEKTNSGKIEKDNISIKQILNTRIRFDFVSIADLNKFQISNTRESFETTTQSIFPKLRLIIMLINVKDIYLYLSLIFIDNS